MPDAPIEYVENYYQLDCHRWESFPDVSAFIWKFLGYVNADVVLNPGCGPQLYHYMSKFERPPQKYIGVDISRSTIRYLRESSNPHFCEAKEQAEAVAAEIEIICADLFDQADYLSNSIDTIVATGFIGTFHGSDLDRLIDLLRQALKPNGKLIKLTWHGPHRTPEQNAEKLRYGYDKADEHEPQAFLRQITDRGFETVAHELFTCDPESYFWDLIQGCVLSRTD